MPALIDDTYAEAFRSIYAECLITARDRKWLDPLTRKPLSFEAVIDWLAGIADTLVETNGNAIEVRCVGINAWRDVPSPATKGRSAKKSTKKPSRGGKKIAARRRP